MNENDLSDLVFKNKKEWGFQNKAHTCKKCTKATASKKILVIIFLKKILREENTHIEWFCTAVKCTAACVCMRVFAKAARVRRRSTYFTFLSFLSALVQGFVFLNQKRSRRFANLNVKPIRQHKRQQRERKDERRTTTYIGYGRISRKDVDR